MKFGKDFRKQMIPEWVAAYMDYYGLQQILRELRSFKEANKTVHNTLSIQHQLSISKAFGGLSSLHTAIGHHEHKQQHHYHHHHHHHLHHLHHEKAKGDIEDQVISITSEPGQSSNTIMYKTEWLDTPDERQGGQYEVDFFKKLDEELNKVNTFYRHKVEEVMEEASDLGKQMNAFIALQIKVQNPDLAASETATNDQELGVLDSDYSHDVNRKSLESSNIDNKPDPFEILDHVRLTNPGGIKRVLKDSKDRDLSFSKDELKEVKEKLKVAFFEFYQKLRLLKKFSYMNLLAFSKIMKKYEKITSKYAAASYMKTLDKSYLGSSDEVNVLLEKIEYICVKHFFYTNRRKGMKYLRQAKRKSPHRITFFSGFFFGCSVALLIAIILMVESRKVILVQKGIIFLVNLLQIYSAFTFIVLHIFMYAADAYFWRRCGINYPFIFNFKQGTELGYREVFLLGSSFLVLALGGFLVNFHLVIRLSATTGAHMTLAKLIPASLIAIGLAITFCPFNIIYRSSRVFFLKCLFRCICAPFYQVTLPDFFLADQITSQIQALRSIEFCICFYSGGDFSRSQSQCHENDVYHIFYYIIALVPYWIRCLQCLRRFVEEGDRSQALNAVKYLLTIIAVVIRTVYRFREGTGWLTLAVLSSAVAVSMNIYWDLVADWGLLRWRSKNFLLRDKLMVPHKSIYFIAMGINVLLRIVWLQLVLEFKVSIVHRVAIANTSSCLEIMRRGMWSFFRLENEHLNNVGKFRAFKSVPLPFSYYDEKLEVDDKDE